jgi:hypothetical protein
MCLDLSAISFVAICMFISTIDMSITDQRLATHLSAVLLRSDRTAAGTRPGNLCDPMMLVLV